jgi:tetratricopeptide (TPR) repeat protein
MSLFFGQSLQKIENVTHPFEPLPKTVTLSRHSKREIRTRLDYCDHAPEQVFAFLNATGKRGEALAFAESHLKLNPSDDRLMREYLEELLKKKEAQRAENFFPGLIALRPVSIELHRAWQSFIETHAPEKNLAAVYDEFLAKEPNNSALLYLRARVAHQRDEELAFCEKALAADPKNAWAHYGIGFVHLSHGDWARAKDHFAQAVKLVPSNDKFAHYLTVASLAAGETSRVESDLRARLEKEAHVRSIVALLPILGSQNKISDAEAVITAFVRRLKQQMADEAGSVVAPLRCLLAYSSQNFTELEKLSRQGRKSSERKYLLTSALVEQNRIADAEAAVSDKTEDDPFGALILSLAWDLSGEPAKGKTWADRAITQLAQGSRDQRVAHKLLTSSAPPSDDDFLALESDLRERAIVAGYLKLHHPSESARFAKWIDTFNVECTYPYYLLKKVSARPLMTAGQ